MTKVEKKAWSRKEIKFLRNNWSVMTGSDIAKELGRGSRAVYAKAVNLGLRKNIKHKVTSRKVEAKVKPAPVVQRTFSFGNTHVAIKMNESRVNWTPEEDRFLEDSYNLLTAAEIGERLGRTRLSVCNRIRKKGLKKTQRKVNTNIRVKATSKARAVSKVQGVKKERNISVQSIFTSISVLANIGLALLVIYLLFIK